MKVLLTGANGFLGRHVLRSLEEHGIETVLVGRTHPEKTGHKSITADLLNVDFDALVRQADATHLLHLAWYVEHGKYWSSPLNLRWVECSVRLAESFCKAGGQKIVVAGTCFEYGKSDAPCLEDSTPIEPGTFYGMAKDATRRLIAATCAHYQVPYAWGRIFIPFGEGEDSLRLIPSLIAALQGERKPFGVNKNAYRDFIYASDVAEAFVALLQPHASGIYNISSGEGTQIERVVMDIADITRADPDVILSLATERPGESEFLVGDNRKLQALGWHPRQPMASALAQIVRSAP